ncbi:alpha/beta hydrolase [Mesorhizobium sp. CO1-1-7]|uniref:Esterase/lipase n=1 Tax=Mesorhizobium australicum (strain HAMBI 3006 / LMG 24608 / WSM2073) TaxID=754035 RepID=L0KN87_MESAW|nr:MULTISPECIES: alpha/beta hydrolase [Mesorhizobium]AGB45563.1 esterase/lipase [Mesorhizobium australicum WSM2073]MBZ9746508.1 alpha/beta hydrolase [Mesorhizobium sp. CO1-1-7]
MASMQSQANRNHYAALAANAGKLTSPQAVIDYNDVNWTALTGEPGGVDYIEVDAGGVPAMWIVPKGADEQRVLFYAHGGGFIGGSIYTHRKLVGHLAKAIGCRALLYDYPLAHQAKHPAQIEAATSAWDWLVDQGFDPKRIVIAGDSCGAVPTYGVLQRLRAQRRPLPVATLIISGWFDMALTGASYETNRDKDPAFAREAVDWLAANFIGDADRRDPEVSPLYADLSGFPPVFLQVGADETLVDESRMFAERARQAGVETRLDVFDGMLHSFQMMAGRAPEADDAIARFAAWVRPRLGLPAPGEKTSEKAA